MGLNKNTGIEWARWTWNPVTGCLHGCEYCYARDIANRFPKEFVSEFRPTFHSDRLKDPYNKKVPKAAAENVAYKNIFVCSMADLFGDWVNREWILKIIKVVKDNPQWNFLFLTKNPDRYMEFYQELVGVYNAWFGATVDCQDALVDTIDSMHRLKVSLQTTPLSREVVTFISFEPLRELIHFNSVASLRRINLAIIGAQSKSTGCPAMQPKWEWVERIIHEARSCDCKVYLKPNVTVRPMELPTECFSRTLGEAGM